MRKWPELRSNWPPKSDACGAACLGRYVQDPSTEGFHARSAVSCRFRRIAIKPGTGKTHRAYRWH